MIEWINKFKNASCIALEVKERLKRFQIKKYFLDENTALLGADLIVNGEFGDDLTVKYFFDFHWTQKTCGEFKTECQHSFGY